MMNDLHDEIPPIIAAYLPPLDAINFSCSSNQLLSQLSLSITRPRQLLRNFSRDDRNDDVHPGFPIPVLSQVSVHTMLVSMNWKDQGWGNRKGRLFLVAEQKSEIYEEPGRHNDEFSICSPYDRSEQFGGRRVVFSSGIAPHLSEKLNITFKPRQGEAYSLWYVVGGGGGHSFHLQHVDVRALLFGDSLSYFRKAHDFLARSAVSRPWDRESEPDRFDPGSLETILASTRYSIAHGLQILPPMLSFFEGCGFSEEDLSGDRGRMLMDSIESVRNDWQQDRISYNNAASDRRTQRRIR